MTESKKKMKRSPIRIACVIACSIVSLIAILLVGVNAFVFFGYSAYFEVAERDLSIPGINSGFIPQDVKHMEDADLWLYSGYMGGDGPSPVYKQAADGSATSFFIETPDGLYDGHGGGITAFGGFVYITCDEGYYVLSAQDVIDVADKGTVQIAAQMDLDFSPAFINVQDGTLFVGNFHLDGVYDTHESHHIDTLDGGKNKALIYAYDARDDAEYAFASTPDRVYSIPSKVQGVCLTEGGNMVLSTSYGLADSHLLSFDLESAQQDGIFSTDSFSAPLTILDSRTLVADIVAPPMAEGLDSYEGRVFISYESASNKYIFGKLYGAGAVYSIPFCAFE